MKWPCEILGAAPGVPLPTADTPSVCSHTLGRSRRLQGARRTSLPRTCPHSGRRLQARCPEAARGRRSPLLHGNGRRVGAESAARRQDRLGLAAVTSGCLLKQAAGAVSGSANGARRGVGGAASASGRPTHAHRCRRRGCRLPGLSRQSWCCSLRSKHSAQHQVSTNKLWRAL